MYNAALKEFILSYLAHRERPPLLEKDEEFGLNKTTDVLDGNIMADFDKRVCHCNLVYILLLFSFSFIWILSNVPNDQIFLSSQIISKSSSECSLECSFLL